MTASLRGQFLIAGKNLRDPNFFKTVVLIVQHDEAGAMGLVVNRPSSVTVAHALAGHFHLPETDDLVFVGGPVEPAALFVLHNARELDGNEAPVIPGLFVGSSAETFEQVIREAAAGTSPLHFRIFCGCAGWAPGQLEGELDRGDWYLQPAITDLILQHDPYELWDAMLAKVRAANRIVPPTPSDPERN